MSSPKRGSKKKKKSETDLELLTLQVRRLANELDGVGARMKEVTLTSEEIKIVLGELRACRHLLDVKREFRHLDLVKDPPSLQPSTEIASKSP